MTKEMLMEKIEEMITDVSESINNDYKIGIDIQGNDYTFAIRVLTLAGDVVVTFGGYGVNFKIYSVEVYEPDEITEEFIKYISVFDNEKLKDCKIIPEITTL